MADTITSRQARAWNAARLYYQQCDLAVAAMGPNTPLDESEDAECALELARRDFLELNAPTLDGVCERIILTWGEKLFDQDDPDMDDLRSILGNLRLLSNELS
ncbi:hypothetical protein [Novosphingobium sp. PASSN1]|uniref:hypothetical protein n=1 Tax=Novosphingobium sp. PASSN1 TaxID=2015561 RepID=UPI0025DF9E06|nr:hypothetical protein [Novosphingobium sp. PASSN1]